MGAAIQPVETAGTRRDFLLLPWRVYAGNPRWVPPLLSRMKKTIDARRNGFLHKGPHRLFVAYRGGTA